MFFCFRLHKPAYWPNFVKKKSIAPPTMKKALLIFLLLPFLSIFSCNKPTDCLIPYINFKFAGFPYPSKIMIKACKRGSFFAVVYDSVSQDDTVLSEFPVTSVVGGFMIHWNIYNYDYLVTTSLNSKTYKIRDLQYSPLTTKGIGGNKCSDPLTYYLNDSLISVPSSIFSGQPEADDFIFINY